MRLLPAPPGVPPRPAPPAGPAAERPGGPRPAAIAAGRRRAPASRPRPTRPRSPDLPPPGSPGTPRPRRLGATLAACRLELAVLQDRLARSSLPAAARAELEERIVALAARTGRLAVLRDRLLQVLLG